MADKVVPGPVEGSAAVREAVCIHTRKIFDACRDKDCVEDLRVYPTVSSQTKLDSALSVRPRSAELLCADVRVKEITFNKGYYTVDVTYFYRVRGETFPGCEPVSGLAIFDKRVMLFGSQASVKVFDSDGGGCAPCEEGLPIGVVESVDPIALHMKLVDCAAAGETDPEPHAIPQAILDAMGEALSLTCSGKKLLVTLGQFSIIRLERDTQLLIPAYDYCMPDKACQGSTSAVISSSLSGLERGRSMLDVQPYPLPHRRVLPAGLHHAGRRLPQSAVRHDTEKSHRFAPMGFCFQFLCTTSPVDLRMLSAGMTPRTHDTG